MASHASSVHGLPSLQDTAPPALQLPAAQASPTVQTLLSLHGTVFCLLAQPLLGEQLSSVHRLPSSQFLAAPGTQLDLAQASLVVHTLLSLHVAALAAWVHPFVASRQAGC